LSIADDLVAAFEPWLTDDLEDYLRAIAVMFSEVELYAFDRDPVSVPMVLASNLFVNPSLEDGIAGWAPEQTFLFADTCTLAQSTDQALYGTHSLKQVSSLSGAGSANKIRADSPIIPIEHPGGAAIVGSASAYSTTARTVSLAIACVSNLAGTVVSLDRVDVAIPANTWTRLSVEGAAPFGTIGARLVPAHDGAGGVGSITYWDGFKISRAGEYDGYVDIDHGPGDIDWIGLPGLSGVQSLTTTEREVDGWTVLFDPDLAPAPALPYLAAIVGETLPAGISDLEAREWIKDKPNSIRGTIGSIWRAAQRKLTGSRLVTLRQRFYTNVANVDGVEVRTFTQQTPDSAGTRADIESVFPFAQGLKLDYQVLTGRTWANVNSGYATWALVNSHYPTWNEVLSDLSGYASFTRE
jgi:hypothetical protein